MTQPFHHPMTALAEGSDDFRRVVWTGRLAQLVVMTIPPGGEIGAEVHAHTDQVIGVIAGLGRAIVDDHDAALAPGDVVTVAAGARHNIVNAGPLPFVLWTVYAPPEHSVDAVHHSRADAEAAEASGEDVPPPAL
jgi:mannose-6-phosphate isomerase-like protein (cupin superfamily)